MEEQLPYYEDRQQEAYDDYKNLVQERDSLLSRSLRQDADINSLRARNAELEADINELQKELDENRTTHSMNLAEKLRLSQKRNAKLEESLATVQAERNTSIEGSIKDVSELLDLRAEVARLRKVLDRIARWEFNLNGDCVADAQEVARAALAQKGGEDGLRRRHDGKTM